MARSNPTILMEFTDPKITQEQILAADAHAVFMIINPPS